QVKTMLPRIGELFKERSLFITGASGFLGKVLVEKLLYSVPDVKRIYIIVRSSRGKSARERWTVITEGILFDRLRRECPDALKKVIVVEGDLMEENLGMSQHDIQRLCDEVSVVFHCAATVKFDEKLREAVGMNVKGTTRLISLCHKMPKLACLVHCSTAYANCDRQKTEEMVYPAPVNPQKLNETLDWMDEKMVDVITPHLLGQRPNTYTLTKALAESQLMEDAQGLPVIIFRPSIVCAMWREQLPGWLDNVNGPAGLFIAVGKGVLTSMPGDLSAVADLIPVDVVANMMIATGAFRLNSSSTHIPIVHCTSGQLNPVTWNDVVSFLREVYKEYPMPDAFGVPDAIFFKSNAKFEFEHRLRHEIPAKCLDIACQLVGKKAIYSRLYGKVRTMVHTLEYFTTRGWHFENKGLPMLWEALHPEDKKIFNFDVRQINWSNYLFDYVMGVRKYITKENLVDKKVQSAAKANIKKIQRVKFLVRLIACYGIAKLMSRYSKKYPFWKYFAAFFLTSQVIANISYKPVHRLKSLDDYLKEQKSHQIA
ncbi:hypothetical protein PENTCL1PPCAC_28739, partial [Pristionchus entomophagus]